MMMIMPGIFTNGINTYRYSFHWYSVRTPCWRWWQWWWRWWQWWWRWWQWWWRWWQWWWRWWGCWCRPGDALEAEVGSRHPGHTGQRCLHHIVRDALAYTLYCTRCLRLYIEHNTHCEKITYLRLHFINVKCKMFTSPWLPSYFKFWIV